MMAALAEVVCGRRASKGGSGRILEVGYGLGLSAFAIDELGCTDGTEEDVGIVEHVIIEANKEVAETARTFAKETAKVKTTVLEGFWQEECMRLEDGSFSGILFDAFPLQKSEVIDGEAYAFFQTAARLLEPGGVFTFYFDLADSWIATRQAFKGEITKQLLAAGFSRVEEGEEVAVNPPKECEYFWKSAFLVPVCIR